MNMILHVGGEPDFLMKLDRVDVMHSLTVCIFENHGPKRQNIKIVDRSFHNVCFDFNCLLRAKIGTNEWKISQNEQDKDEFEFESDQTSVRVKFNFPAGLSPRIRINLRRRLLDNLLGFSKISCF